MQFRKYGAHYQLAIESAADMRSVLDLDEALWAATGAPVNAFRGDPALPRLLDADGNGRIKSDEVKQALQWLLDHLADASGLTRASGALALSAIRPGAPDGQGMHRAAAYILEAAGRPGAASIAIEDVRAFLADVQRRPLNGDGIVVAEAAPDEETAAFIRDVVSCVGGAEDAAGVIGVQAGQVQSFMDALTGYLAWQERASVADRAMLPFGDDTPAVCELVSRHATKIDQFFALCRLCRFRPRAAGRLSRCDAAFDPADLRDSAAVDAGLAEAPIADPAAGDALPLRGPQVNPLYADWLQAVAERVIVPLLGEEGPDALTEEQWRRIGAALAPYRAYLDEKTGVAVEKLSADRLRAYRDGPHAERTRALIEEDRKVATVAEAGRQLERLLLYHRDMFRFLNNFVSFRDLYDGASRALFEAGAAVIDGRWFDLAVEVEDPARHAARAELGSLFTMYLEIEAGNGGPSRVVALPATSGSRGNLGMGKRGVFFDVDGTEHDARIVRIVENPISLQEALLAPFARLWGFVVGKIEAMSTASERALQSATGSIVVPAPVAPAQPAPAGGGTAIGRSGLLMGFGVSLAAIGSAFAFITKTFAALSAAEVLLGFAGAAFVVMVPVSFIAVLKLRRQDLSALLEGCGWAVNARMRLTRSQRRQFTRRPPYPHGATGAPRRCGVGRLFAVSAAAAALAWLAGRLLGAWTWR